MSNQSEEFEKQRRWLKTYRVRWNVVSMRDDKFITTEKQADIVARSFIDCMAKTELLYKCNMKELLCIDFKGFVQEFGEDE